jgi:hypothetical protein
MNIRLSEARTKTAIGALTAGVFVAHCARKV